MQKLRRFARYWDLVGNSGNFVETTPMIWGVVVQASRLSQTPPQASAEGAASFDSGRLTAAQAGGTPAPLSAFSAFMKWSEWLHARTGRTDSIALVRLMELLFEFLTGEVRHDPQQAAAVMWRDYQRGGRHDKPAFLKDFLPADTLPAASHRTRPGAPKRQARHWA